jgi:hypothetical protein
MASRAAADAGAAWTEHAWDWTAALAWLQRFLVAHLGDPDAIVVLDETAELRKGDRTAGVGRQHAGITGQVENCQAVVFAAYVTARAHGLSDFRPSPPPAGTRSPGAPPAGTGDGQPVAWRDTGKLPASASDHPPGDDPGLVKVSVPETRWLARMAAGPVSCAARGLGYAWSRWRRRHYHARLKAARVI